MVLGGNGAIVEFSVRLRRAVRMSAIPARIKSFVDGVGISILSGNHCIVSVVRTAC